MHSTIEEILGFLQNNQILSTVAGGSVIVWLVSNIKGIWNKLVNALTALISFQIVNTYEDNRVNGSSIPTAQKVFDNFVASSRILWERTNNLDLSEHQSCGPRKIPRQERKERIGRLAFGFSIRILLGKIVFCTREIEKNQKITATTTLRVFFASKKQYMDRLVNRVILEVENEAAKQSSRDTITIWNGECGSGSKLKRPMDSIFTNNNEHYKLLADIKAFLDNKDKYVKLAYPYKFTALLYGEPGCGKSSSILAIASALNKDITYINLAKTNIEKLLARINTAGGDIIVFEDIDALTTSITESREKKDSTKKDGQTQANAEQMDMLSTIGGTSLSEILNFTDGLLASDGTISLFTTNHIERLDPALLRDGRMNALVEFRNLNSETAAKMIKANLGISVKPSELKDKINPAQLQADILSITLGKVSREEALLPYYKNNERPRGKRW